MPDEFRSPQPMTLDAIIMELLAKEEGNTPEELLAQMARVIYDERIARVPAVKFIRSKVREHSRGTTYRDRIVLSLGTDQEMSMRMLTIHEMAHWIMPRLHHSAFYYEKLWAMYDRYNIDMGVAQAIEFGYKPYSAKMGYALYMRANGNKWSFDDRTK